MSNRNILKFVLAAGIITSVVTTSSEAPAEGWLLRRIPAIALGGMIATTVAATHAIRDTIGIVIASGGHDPDREEMLKAEVVAHPFAGPQAAVDTAARVVKAHPELRSNAVTVLQDLGIPLETFETRLTTLEHETSATDADSTDNRENRCPQPTPVNESMSPRAAAYQQQITNLPPGMMIYLGNVKFDGCRPSDGTLLEAKGQAYEEFLLNAFEKKPWYKKDEIVMDQARRQARVAAIENRKLEWHFAEKLTSQYYGNRFKLDDDARAIIVIYDPPLQ